MNGMTLEQLKRSDVPRIFQVLIVIYVLLTGAIPQAVQAAMHGLSGGGNTAFTLAFLSAIAVDIVRLAPIFVLARHPLGILHPLIIAILIWPLLVGMPSVIQEFGGLGGLLLGEPVKSPFFTGLGWRPASEVWWAAAGYNMLQILGLLSTYFGFAQFQGGRQHFTFSQNAFDTIELRRLLVILIVTTLIGLMIFLSYRGGVDNHLAELSRGRFRALAGLGPLIAIFDIGIIALILWVAARPQDVKTLLFLGAVLTVSATQFLSNGSRAGTLYLVMLIAITWSLKTQRIPWRLALAMIPVIFLSLGLLNIIRTSALSDRSAVEAISMADTSTVLTQIQDEIELRRSLAGPIPVIVDGFRVADGPLLGASYLGAVFAFVPRYLWEEKPRGPGSLYAQYFLGEVREGTAVPIGPTAEAYWNFGIVGVIILSFIYGFLLRKASSIYMANSDNPFVTALFVTFITSFHIYTDDLVLFQQYLLIFLIIYLIAKLTIRRTVVETARLYQQGGGVRV